MGGSRVEGDARDAPQPEKCPRILRFDLQAFLKQIPRLHLVSRYGSDPSQGSKAKSGRVAH